MALKTTTNNIIDVSNLSFAYDKEKVLEEINFTVGQKDFLAIIGPNGGGKSSLLKLLLGINTLTQGDIKLFSKDYKTQTKHLGYLPQNTNININFPISVLEVVMMGQNSLKKRMFGYKKDELKKAHEALEKVDMKSYASQKISDLSGGQRQRVFIARTLFSDPKVLILDEPTSSIDVKGCEQIYKTLQNLNKKIPIIVVSHDISVILQYATRAFYINKTLIDHDLNFMKKEFQKNEGHICEIELLEMLGKCKC
jgi:zinc transport system ATP-binding protein